MRFKDPYSFTFYRTSLSIPPLRIVVFNGVAKYGRSWYIGAKKYGLKGRGSQCNSYLTKITKQKAIEMVGDQQFKNILKNCKYTNQEMDRKP